MDSCINTQVHTEKEHAEGPWADGGIVLDGDDLRQYILGFLKDTNCVIGGAVFDIGNLVLGLLCQGELFVAGGIGWDFLVGFNGWNWALRAHLFGVHGREFQVGTGWVWQGDSLNTGYVYSTSCKEQGGPQSYIYTTAGILLNMAISVPVIVLYFTSGD